MEFIGNRTECALLMMLRAWGVSYEALRQRHKADVFRVYDFSSERKMASAILRTPGGGLRLYNKARACSLLAHRYCVWAPPACMVGNMRVPQY